MKPFLPATAAVRLAVLALAAMPLAQDAAAQLVSPECGFEQASRNLADYAARARRGEVDVRPPPVVAPRDVSQQDGAPGLVTAEDIFPFEDTAGLYLTNLTVEEENALLVEAANALLEEHGDNFDFIGYWMNFQPLVQFGLAYYSAVENDVLGIGDVGGVFGLPEPTFNIRADVGLAGEHIEGVVMMYDINGNWQPGTGTAAADLTRLAIGQEFEHRFALFLEPLAGGQVLQGDDTQCGRTLHWSRRVDGQASAMEIAEWTGGPPTATLDPFALNFNTDTGGLFSYTDLYLMGYVTPAQMDAGNSELRFMDNSPCFQSYSGPVTEFTSADIIATNGVRVPDAATEDKHYRTGWIMFHQPGNPPTLADKTKAAQILNQATLDWSTSTLGEGSMDHTLPDPAPFLDKGFGLAGANGVPVLSATGTLVGATPVSFLLTGALDEATARLVIGATQLFAPFKGGMLIPAPNAIVTAVTDDSGALTLGGTWPVGLSGQSLYFQHWIEDATAPSGFSASNGLEALVP